MRSIRSLLTYAVLAASLTSCGVLNTFLPDQTLTDPLGIDGESVTLIQGDFGTLLSAQQAQQLWTTGSEPIDYPLTDIDASEIPDWVDPSALTVDVGIEETVVLSSSTATSEADFSDTFTLDMAAFLNGTISDPGTGATADLPDFTTPDGASVALEKQECTGPAPMVCAYAAVDGLADFVIEVVVDGPNMDALYEILTTGSETNTISITMELAATGTAPSDTTITVTFDAPSGTLSF